MSGLTGTYLRILKPKTSNGIIPLIGEDRRVVMKEVFLPLSAKKELEKINKRLPDGLKMTIQETDGTPSKNAQFSTKKPPKNDKATDPEL